MYEIEAQNQANQLLGIYYSEYEVRYGTKPLDVSAADRTFLKDLVYKLGFETAESIVRGFLCSNHPWFITKSHSVLSLKGNIDVVNTSLVSKTPRIQTSRTMIRALIYCDNCGNRRENQVSLNYDFDKRTLCVECKRIEP